MAELGLEEFLGYETSSRGGGKFLSKWKDRTPPEVRVWLHTRTPFVTNWVHQIPQLRTFEDRDTRETVRKIWGGKFNCLEHDTLLQQQNKRNNGVREIPPQVCPLCMLLECVRQMIADKRLSKAQPIFRFEVPLLPGEDPADRSDDQLRILSAGAFTDTFKGDLTVQEKQDIRKAGISLKDAWRDNGRAKCNFVLRVVDNDNVDDGVQICVETSLVGEKLQQVIRDQMKRLGRQEGNPLLNPYAFQIEHKPKEQQFQNKYHVLDLSPKAYPLTPEIRQLIVDEDPPDITRITQPGNVRTLRAQLEQYALVPLPWDQLFHAAELMQANQQLADDDTSFEFGANAEGAVAEADGAFQTEAPAVVAAQVPAALERPPAAAAQVAPAVTTASVAAAVKPTSTRQRVPAPPKEEPMGDPCDECQHPMKATEYKCPGCGQEYQQVPDPVAAAPAAPPPQQAAKVQPPKQEAGTVLGKDGIVAGSPQDKLGW